MKEMALQITSTAENSTTDWSSSYADIEDIHVGRGYTGGLVGFTTATGDMLDLVRRYEAERPDNPLVPYLPGLQACADYGDTVDDAEYGLYGGGASSSAEVGRRIVRRHPIPYGRTTALPVRW